MNKCPVFLIIFIFLASFIYCESPGIIDYKNPEHDDSEKTDADKKDNIDISGIKNPEELWKQFLLSSDVSKQAEILIILGSLAKGNRQIIDNINNYLMGMNLLFRSGSTVHYTLVSANISALMELGDNSSYPALFSVLYAGYPEVITSEAFGALEVIPGSLHQFLLNVIENNPPDEKFAAFRAGVRSERMTIPQRGQIAERALERSLANSDDDLYLSALRYSAVLTLTSLRWTRANSLAIRHYYRVQSDYQREIVPKERLIEAITCLGAVGNPDAALVLGLQLGLINVRMESTGFYDPEITLAIVQALGNIGYHAVFEHLIQVRNLLYLEDIQIAAREAVDRLKW